MEKAVSDRIKCIQAERLYFGCLRFGQQSKSCKCRSVCDICNKRHPTCLHEERDKKEKCPLQAKQNPSQERYREIPQSLRHEETTAATSNRVILGEANAQKAAVISVWLSSLTQPEQ